MTYLPRMLCATLALLVVPVLATPAHADPPPPSSSSVPNAPAEIQAELMQVQQTLVEVEEKAMADPALVRAREKIEADLEKALKAADPSYPKKVERMEAILKELQAKAELDAGEEQMMPLVQEGQQLQQELQALQTRVLEDGAMSARIESFHADVRKKMVEIDPKTTQLIERADALLEAMRRHQGS